MTGELINRPAFLSDPSVQVDNSDLNQYSKPPRIKVVQALSRPPVKPPFKEGDVVVVPQLVKIGDNEEPFTFVVVHFFPSWVCLNPIQMQGTLRSIREFSMDPQSDVAKNAKSFAKIKCPENPEFYLKYNETLNFFVILEGHPDLDDMPVHLFFSRGGYQVGQQLIGELQLRKAPRYACRFRACSASLTNKQGQAWQALKFFNDPQPWVDEAHFRKYEKLHKDLDDLIRARAVDLDLNDVGSEELPDEKPEF